MNIPPRNDNQMTALSRCFWHQKAGVKPEKRPIKYVIYFNINKLLRPDPIETYKDQVGGWRRWRNQARITRIRSIWYAGALRRQTAISALPCGAPHLISMPSFGL